MGKPARHSRRQESSRVAFPAFRRVRTPWPAAPFLLALLLLSAMACGDAATSGPPDPTKTPAVVNTPEVLTEAPTVTGSPAAPVETPAPAETPTVTRPPVIPTETPEATDVPPEATDVPPEATDVPPEATDVPTVQPTPTRPPPVPPTATATVPPTETPAPIQGPVVKIGDALFPVDLALTPEQRSQGLSGREVMAAETGMLFIFENEGTFSFWMKEMHFPLDIVWIGADCTVVDVTLGAPPPEEGQALADLPKFSPSSPALYVLEINAGEYAEQGIEPGDLVEFVGDLEGLHGC